MAPADHEASIKDLRFKRLGLGGTVLPPDHEEGREQREVPGLVWEWF